MVIYDYMVFFINAKFKKADKTGAQQRIAMIGMDTDEIETSIKPLEKAFIRNLCVFPGRECSCPEINFLFL